MVPASCRPCAAQTDRQRQWENTPAEVFLSKIKESLDMNTLRLFRLSEMRMATQGFNKRVRIGLCWFGDVYRGVIGVGEQKVAIKRVKYLEVDAQHIHELQIELEMLSKLSHRNIVSLVGVCLEDPNRLIIVYEYMAHGKLRHHLYGSQKPPLSWEHRINICIDAARGLHYLHSQATSHAIFHGDVNTRNILLNSCRGAKLSGFTWSMVGRNSMEESDPITNTFAGSFGYLDPEYLRSRQMSAKSDVYSFGMMLLEVLFARQPLDTSLPETQANLREWSLYCQKKGTLEEAIDPNLKGQITPECLKMFVDTALICLADHGMDRPTMGNVLRNLEVAFHLQRCPTGLAPSTLAQGKHKTIGSSRTNKPGAMASFLPHCRHVSLESIKHATDNFNENRLIGGAHSRIYKGDLAGVDIPVAIKLTSAQSMWETEIPILSMLRHRNIVSSIGYHYKHDSGMTLIYDYMALGNLQQHLYDSEKPPLPWKTRLNVCIGVASALDYLHSGSGEAIVHGNVNTTNILLNNDFIPKLSGFGAIKEISSVPNDVLKLSLDVHSFGVVLFEILCARAAVDLSLPSDQQVLAKWALHCQENGMLEEIIDPHLKGEISPDCFKVFVETVIQCLAESAVNRPIMTAVLLNLEFALQLQEDFDMRFFTFAEVRKATNDFDKVLLIGEGEFGKVYRGAIDGGATHVAIKRENPETQLGFSEHKNDIEMIFKLRHHHLVSLLGCCVEKSEMILVYDYMANGSLRGHLYKSRKPPLVWKQRLEICIGAARGLHYLHAEAARKAIVHGGVRTSNILLDYKWVSKLADFRRLSRVPTRDSGDLALEMESEKSEKSDVYSFGVVLLEVLCARPVLDCFLLKNQTGLAEWARRFIDPHLKGKIKRECFRKFLETAVKCLADSKFDRPAIGDVLSNLELALHLQESSATEDD